MFRLLINDTITRNMQSMIIECLISHHIGHKYLGALIRLLPASAYSEKAELEVLKLGIEYIRKYDSVSSFQDIFDILLMHPTYDHV